MTTMPLDEGTIMTSPYGNRAGGFHWGTDYGKEGGSGGLPVYAVKSGTVTRSGPASGFGRWVTIDHPASNGGGETIYGHVIPEVSVGQRVSEGQRVARIDPNSATNGGVAPHLHLEWHRFSWAPPGPNRLDPAVMLAGARWPGQSSPPGGGLTADSLSEVMGNVHGVDYAGLLPGYVNAMEAADITTVERAAMWAAQLGHESVGLRYMEEIASGAAYNGRRDLGNIYPGDGPRFKGRGPIQLTGRSNYRAFTRWARTNGHTNFDFEANPHLLADPHWGFLAATYYWTAARPQINSLSDARNLEAVTRAINGGLNGLDDRRNRYNRALKMGARLLPQEEFSMAGIEALKKHITAEHEKTRKHITEFIGGFVGPIGSDVKDVRQQITGGRDKGEYPGFSQIDNRTIVDAVSAIGTKLEVPGFEDIHNGSLKAKQEGESDEK